MVSTGNSFSRRSKRACGIDLISKDNSIRALTFPSPVSLGGKSDVAAIFPVKFCHQGFVRVSYDQNAGVKRFYLLFAALVRLNADGPAATPVVSLPFEPCETATPPR